jgi:hypothetical protein
MAPRTSLAANNSTLACDSVEAKAKPLRLGFINIALVNDSERMLNLVEPPIYPQFNIFLRGEFVTCVPQIYFFFSMWETVRDCFRIHVQYLLIRFLLPIYSHYLTVLFL